MGILNFSPSFPSSFSRASALSIVLTPVQAVLALLLPGQPAAADAAVAPCRPPQYRKAMRPAAFRQASWRAGAARVALPGPAASKSKGPSRLKVLREFEPGVGPAFAGRMVISGRMADVCAELDRMARRESAAH